MAEFYLPPELDELKSLKQWVCYVNKWDSGKQKFKKIPINPATGHGAKADDPQTWGTYPEAVQAMQARNFSGIGFEFGSGYLGIDLDNCINDQGHLHELAAEVVQTLDSYTEYSPSGKGLHILAKTTLDKIGRRNDNIGLEMYNSGRFFTVTGKVFGEPKPIQERTEQVQAVRQKHLPEQTNTPQLVESYSTESTSDLWDKMFASQHGAAIKSLYNGNTSEHSGDDSRADLALISHLAYWTNGDPSKMDEMFRQSGLMRPKWDRKTGSSTYGERTINEALGNFRPYVVAEMRPEIKKFMENAKPDNIKDYLQTEFKADLERFQSFKDRKTGFSNLDELTSLYPGLYVIGAISSLGKTTFVHQMGDQLAKAGNHVLFFSLEQTRLEMVSKSISRKTALNAQKEGSSSYAVSAIDIRRGNNTAIVKAAIKEYAEESELISVIECGFDTTVKSILDYVQEYIKANDGVAPVVIVDYLQIIQPTDNRQTPNKDIVDRHVRALKKLQSDNDLVVIVISSINRSNYLTPIDFESFKESGGIEYTSDVVWGLQLAIMNDEKFDKEGKVKSKREAVREAKLEQPRKIELVCLKNRYGVSSYSCGFNYYPMFDLFCPDNERQRAMIEMTDDFEVVDSLDDLLS